MIRKLVTLVVTGLCATVVADLPEVDPAIKARLLAQLRAELAAGGVPPSSGPLRVHKDGSESMRIGADQVSIVVATTKADGTLQTQCVIGAEAAAEVMASAPKPKP
ncbi:MAG: hypothetical protein AB8G17_13335 [Gammaproteobacteria bacterium]